MSCSPVPPFAVALELSKCPTLALARGPAPSAGPTSEEPTPSRSLSHLCSCVALLFAALLCCKLVFTGSGLPPDQEREFSSSCLHAVGGGSVGPRGSLLHFEPRCTDELKVGRAQPGAPGLSAASSAVWPCAPRRKARAEQQHAMQRQASRYLRLHRRSTSQRLTSQKWPALPARPSASSAPALSGS